MKHRITQFVMGTVVAAVATLAVNISTPATAKDTNEAKQGKSEKKVFFFKGGGPLEFILALDNHFRTRLGEILSIPSSLARAEVPKMRVATEDPGEVLGLYNRLDDPMLGKW